MGSIMGFLERIKYTLIHVFMRIKEFLKRVISSKHFIRYAPLAVMALVAVVTFATCVSGQPPEQEPEPEPPAISESPPPASPTASPTLTPEPDPDPDPDPDVEPDTGFRNPLTGLQTEEDISARRPLAIVINNHRDSLPQNGVSKADIIYEYLVEGGSTRMLALYQDVSDVGVIGSVRSARHYTVDLVQSYDAIFIFAGWSPQAQEAVRTRNIDYFDDVSGVGTEIFYRDPNRRATMSSEHTLVTSGARITQHLPNRTFRKDHDEGYLRNLSFIEDGTPDSGEKALEFTVRFGPGSKSTAFSFSDETGLYNLRQQGSAYIDGNDRSQVAVTNVLILEMATAGIPGDGEGRLNITTIGSGDGYYACGGVYVSIKWSREDATSQFRYTLADGSELILGRGKTYICLIRPTGTVEFA